MLRKGLYSGVYQRLCLIIWAAGILALPYSSLPFLAKISNASSVAPLTTFLFCLLALVWWLPYVVRGGKIPAEGVPLFWFAWAALFSTALAFFRPIPSFQNASLFSEARSALITLAMGLTVFFTTASWLRSTKGAVLLTLRLIHFSSLPMLAWSLLQAYYVLVQHSAYPDWIYAVQGFISTSHVSLYIGRITGFAFEPSWLAHQLNTVYLPVWLASTLGGVSVFRRIGKISVENILLVLGVFVLLISFSRVGWLSFGLVMGMVALGLILRLSTWVEMRFFSSLKGFRMAVVRTALFLSLFAGALAMSIGLGVVVFRLGVAYEPRLALMLERNPLEAQNFYDFANRIFIGERVVYWGAGVGVYNSFPILGSGIGAAGFYFPQKLHAFAYGLVEVQNLIYRQAIGFNIKSLWVRLLAETGIVGFALFAGWYASLMVAAPQNSRVRDPLLKTAAVAGFFFMTGFLVEGFSIDSFALPYFWFFAGLLAAVVSLRREMIIDKGFFNE